MILAVLLLVIGLWLVPSLLQEHAPSPAEVTSSPTAEPQPSATPVVPTPILPCGPAHSEGITLTAPLAFTTTLVSASFQGQSYITDVCEYLRDRWDPEKSAPGTVVVPIMFHTVSQGVPYRPGDTHVPLEDLTKTVETARRLGFQTVTATQLADFLEHNARIPPRSMIWILDDRHPDMLEQYFMPIARENGWTMTLGWIIGDTDHRKGLWKQMEEYNATGLLDVQSHGYAHYYVQPDSPEAMLRQELFGPIPILEQHFGRRPIAFVWPGGNFSVQAVQLAREAGYRLGFTVFARGPLLYDWVPLGQAERDVNDPLLVLPRYWARPDLFELLEKAVRIGEEAASRAIEDYASEAAYYRAACGCELPPRRPVL